MIKILIVQTDNRIDVDYLGLTKLANTKTVELLNTNELFNEFSYRYEFIHMKEYHYGTMHPANGKISVMSELLNTIDDDFIVFLDTDAWIQSPDNLHKLILKLKNSDNKLGAFSRDPYISRNTYINSGSFIIKVNDFTRNMYSQISEHLKNYPEFHNKWQYDQHYISDFVFKNKENFMVFVPDILNTPHGKVLRHNWWKDQKLFRNLYDILDNYTRPHIPQEILDFDTLYDNMIYPNPDTYGYEYW